MSLPKLSGKQMEILYLRDDKNLLIKGSAGSGKSLLIMYRAIWLAKKHKDKKILLLTYNRAVNKKIMLDIELICNDLKIGIPDNLEIKTYHTFCLRKLRNILPEIGTEHISSYNIDIKKLSYTDKRKTIIQNILEKLKKEDPDNKTYQRPIFVFEDEISWIQRMNVRSLEEYIAAERIGRQSVRITRSDRPYFFKVYDGYKNELKNTQSEDIYDYEDIGDILKDSYSILRESKTHYFSDLYDYILVDEFQDFSINMLASLQSAKKDGGVISLFGDVKQNIFGKRVSMKRLGITDFATYNIEQNFRNSKEISLYVSRIAESPFLNKKDEFYVKTNISDRITNDPPSIMKFTSKYNELKWIVNYIKDNTSQEIAILTNAKSIKFIKNTLLKNNIEFETTQSKYEKYSNNKKVIVATIKQVKGLEFETVILPFQSIEEYVEMINYNSEQGEIDTNILKLSCNKSEESLAQEDDQGLNETPNEINITNKLEEYISEIYVSVSRAKNKLIITYSNELFPLYPGATKLGE
ncbi:UvrD-helicase domain-containing protein [Macrococcus equi]|uniref:UvrD-helicase domain-containing protein n=1 Tax=Macrococcus equi TaxID=3395462 RepID=UPI0039BE43A0